MRRDEKIFCLMLVAVSLILFIGSLFIVPFEELTVSSPGGYPIMMGALCIIFSLIIFFANKGSKLPEEGVFDRRIIVFFVMLILYYAAIMFIHFIPATLIFLGCAIYYLKREKPWQALLIAYVSTFMIVLIFKYMFRVILP